MSLATATPSGRTFSFLKRGGIMIALAMLVLTAGLATKGHAQTRTMCSNNGDEPGELPVQNKVVGEQPDLLVNGTCTVSKAGPYYFGRVNIVKDGKLIFIEPPKEPSDVKGQDFWAKSIIIENGGALMAGVDPKDPNRVSAQPAYGTNLKTLTIHLYGPDAGDHPGALCAPIIDPVNYVDCGIPKTVWDSNGATKVELPGGVPKDYFYQYGVLHEDAVPPTGPEGHFGDKVLALSFGGTLQLRGKKGTQGTSPEDVAILTKSADLAVQGDEPTITSSGTDWGRLAGQDGTTLTLDRNVQGDWQPGDEVVVTSTDYFPEHSELRTIAQEDPPPAANSIKLNAALDYAHNHTQYDVAAKVGTQATSFRQAIESVDGSNPTPPILDKAETRAAVALLTRSIRIVSEGQTAGDPFPPPATDGSPSFMYGGHVIFRQGFEKLQLQGVEFKQLGQGGRLGRYPVHFHLARRVPADTYIIDSSINESMTRWVVIHSTLGVTVARNVGWKSIGHGYFLEDATETDNKFYSNIGIYARASVVSRDNPRNIPGLLDAPNSPLVLPLKFHSDANYPSVFWITNGWNSFAGNMAAGAGTCGACYWYVPAGNHDMVDVPREGQSMMTPMDWSGYSLIQAASKNDGGSASNARAGFSPVRLFYKNSCSTAMHSLSVSDGSQCTQVEQAYIQHVTNTLAPAAPPTADPRDESQDAKMYYPRYAGYRVPTYCDPAAAADEPGFCGTAHCLNADPVACAPTVISHYTSSFNWAENNFAAIWLRSGYILLDHLFLSDIQDAGVTIVTGGDYTRANLPVGYWGLTTNSIFAGYTRPNDTLTQPTGLTKACNYKGNVCVTTASGTSEPGPTASGVGFPLSNFSTAQRFYNIYDGPAYEEANAFLDIHPHPCNSLADCMYYNLPGVRKAGKDVPGVNPGDGYLPDAAIAWKQSNGFYYPPAFRSQNLFFGGVDIRHYVIEPLTYPGTYRTDVSQVPLQYAGKDLGKNYTFFGNWSDVDRQTELSDDDGSLTGLKGQVSGNGSPAVAQGTVSVNEDPFFRAPVQTSECRSAVGVDASNACNDAQPPAPNPPTARTSPYDHITAALYPADGPGATWDTTCSNEFCAGVPIYRQYLTGVKDDKTKTYTREWKTWMDNGCDGQLAALQGQSRPIPSNDPYGPPVTGTAMLALKPAVPKDIVDRLNAFDKFEKECPQHFVRMAGMNLGQRSVLTVNNGQYFIDTTRSENYQRTSPDLDPTPGRPRFLSVFQAGKSYLVYFLFAKSNTKQTYQIYGGPGFTKANITAVQVDVTTLNPLKGISEITPSPWTVTDDARPGVVDVLVDFSKVTGINLDPTKLNPDKDVMDETCQPHTYCEKLQDSGKTSCGCDHTKLGVLGVLNPNYQKVCDKVCQTWAVKDLDCPTGGCLGFKFTLPSSFTANDQLERPAPSAYPAQTWDPISLIQTPTSPDGTSDPSIKDSCHYSTSQIPSDTNGGTCKVAD